MKNLITCLKEQSPMIGNDCQNLGKKENGSFFGKKVLMSYDTKEGWSSIELNCAELFLRKVFGFYRSTHLDTVIKNYNDNTEFKNVKFKPTISLFRSFDSKIREIWSKSHSTPLPDKVVTEELPKLDLKLMGKKPQVNLSETSKKPQIDITPRLESKKIIDPGLSNTDKFSRKKDLVDPRLTIPATFIAKKPHTNIFETSKKPQIDLSPRLENKKIIDLGLSNRDKPSVKKVEPDSIPGNPSISSPTKIKSEYKKIEKKDLTLKVEKVKGQSQLFTKLYSQVKKLGSGSNGVAYLYNPVDVNGNRIDGKAKVIKESILAQQSIEAMNAGYEIMKDQYVDPNGKPVRSIPGLIKPTKYIDKIKHIIIMSSYDLGDAKVNLPRKPKDPQECFNFVAQTGFAVKHLHSSAGGKKSLVHYDIKPANIFCRNNSKGGIDYALADFDGTHSPFDYSKAHIYTPGHRCEADARMNMDKFDQPTLSKFKKSMDIYALGMTWREFISQIQEDKIYDARTNKGIGGINLVRPMNQTDLPFTDKLSEPDQTKFDGLIKLINEMTDNKWETRPTADEYMSRMLAMGIEVPGYPA